MYPLAIVTVIIYQMYCKAPKKAKTDDRLDARSRAQKNHEIEERFKSLTGSIKDDGISPPSSDDDTQINSSSKRRPKNMGRAF